jgi:glutamyl-tRNA synthetase
LAPSPTGALHLGNARTFLVNWLLARQNDWKIVLRIEDIDGPRIKAGATQQALDDLHWLGLDYDIGPIVQSEFRDRHRDAIDRLIASGNAYPCVCTRKEIELAASAPHAEDGAAVYPGTCRGRFRSVDDARNAAGREPAIRFRVNDEQIIRWQDDFAGEIAIRLGDLGDFVIAKADGTPSYQLAVVVDDAASGVTHVVRGDDLLDSTPRQIALYRALGIEPLPAYCHLPLVVGEDGRRLAKRHGDTRVSHYRDAGVPASRLLQLLARWCGIESDVICSSRDLLSRFDLRSLPRDRIVMTNRDDAFLRES